MTKKIFFADLANILVCQLQLRWGNKIVVVLSSKTCFIKSKV